MTDGTEKVWPLAKKGTDERDVGETKRSNTEKAKQQNTEEIKQQDVGETRRRLFLPPNIHCLEAVECKDNFKIALVDERKKLYRMAWICCPNDINSMAESCPTLVKALKSHKGRAYELLEAKLRAFGLHHLDEYLVQRHYPITKLTVDLGGDLNPRNTYRGFFRDDRPHFIYLDQGKKSGFEIELPWFEPHDDAHSMLKIYNQIVNSEAARDMDPENWRFQWADLPGDPMPEFVIGVQADPASGAVFLANRETLETICKREYPGLEDSIRSKRLTPFVDAEGKQIIVKLQLGESAGERIYLELNPEKYVPMKPGNWYGYDGTANPKWNYD